MKTRVRCSLQGTATKSEESKEEQRLHIHILRLKTVRLALITLNKNKCLNLLYFQMNNATVLPWLLKMGGTENMSITKLEHGDLEVLLGASNHDYCRLSCKPIKCGGRLAILKLQGTIGVETLSKNIPTDQWSRAPQIE